MNREADPSWWQDLAAEARRRVEMEKPSQARKDYLLQLARVAEEKVKALQKEAGNVRS